MVRFLRLSIIFLGSMIMLNDSWAQSRRRASRNHTRLVNVGSCPMSRDGITMGIACKHEHIVSTEREGFLGSKLTTWPMKASVKQLWEVKAHHSDEKNSHRLKLFSSGSEA